MSTIRRILPETIDTRLEALHLAQNKLNTLLPANNPLSANTTSRLAAALTGLSGLAQAVMVAKAPYNDNTPIKESTQAECALFTNHFIQVFNLGVKRGTYTAGQRDYFNLPVSSDVLPDLVRGADVLKWANYVVDGDPLRVTAGGAAMSNPTVTEVHTTLTAFHTAFNDQSTFKDALDLAQEAVENYLDTADKVIKKVWDELETYYNEESDESRRENLIEWGVVYATVGSDKMLSGAVTYNGAPGVGLVVHFKTGKNKSIASAAGAYSLNTTLMDTQIIEINKLDENGVSIKTWTFDVVLTENDDKVQNFTVAD